MPLRLVVFKPVKASIETHRNDSWYRAHSGRIFLPFLFWKVAFIIRPYFAYSPDSFIQSIWKKIVDGFEQRSIQREFMAFKFFEGALWAQRNEVHVGMSF